MTALQYWQKLDADYECVTAEETIREFLGELADKVCEKYMKLKVVDRWYDYHEEMRMDDTRSATCGDYSPSNPWNAPGMSIRDFI